MADLYSKLGIARGADEAEIKKAYRKLAKELHPDRNKGDKRAADRFSEVTAAYDLLSDKDKRAQYDRGELDEQGNPRGPYGYGTGGSGGGGFRPNNRFEFATGDGDLGDLFEGLFGGRRPGGAPSGNGGPFGGFGRNQAPPAKGDDIAYEISVSFEDAASLKPQRLTLASGKMIEVKLPAGVENGQKMRIARQGWEGPGGQGDAIITINIRPHRFFRRDNEDVLLDVPISLDEAIEGASIKIPTVEGAVMLKVMPGTSSGKILRLKGRGFHRKNGTRGDQLVTLMIDIPADDPELQAFAAVWAGRGRNPRTALAG
jgi:DnaJ-class molecular chaperone